jgi:hypothetical protein
MRIIQLSIQTNNKGHIMKNLIVSILVLVSFGANAAQDCNKVMQFATWAGQSKMTDTLWNSDAISKNFEPEDKKMYDDIAAIYSEMPRPFSHKQLTSNVMAKTMELYNACKKEEATK